MENVDDATILKRAKELCEEAGIAWDWLSAKKPGTRVLNDRDRRECLMRARDELINEADAAEPAGEKTVDDATVEVSRIEPSKQAA
jgi:hypothetical protein